MEQHELRQLEEMCIQEHAPVCTASCPIHIDARGMITAVAQGDFAAALKIFRRMAPFPRIIAHTCDAPCQAVCKRAEVGEAIAIGALERAVMQWAPVPSEKVTRLPARDKRVAVVGAGLSGLTAAYDLARKGYRVEIFEARAQSGGALCAVSEKVLPRTAVDADLAVLDELGVRVHLNTLVGKTRINGGPPMLMAGLCEEFEAVFLAMGAGAYENFDLELDAMQRVKVDALTFLTNEGGVFAAGSMLHGDEPYSPIRSISEGRRAAVSIDRHLQRVSLTAARYNEGAYPTRLFTSTVGIAPLPVVPISSPDTGYTPSEAQREAQRCIQCQCLECVKVCEFLDHYGNYPRKYLREIYNNLAIVKGNRLANRMINSCSLCRLCYEVCPTDLDMATVYKKARQKMVAQEKMPASAHDFALRDLAYNTGPDFVLLRNPPGCSTSEYLFFPGCQLAGSDPQRVEQVYGHLQERLPGKVGILLHCCGAPADWAGRIDLFQEAQQALRTQIAQAGNPRLVLACSTCYQMFKENLPDIPIVSLWQLLAEVGLPEKVAVPTGKVVTVHDPCSARYEREIQDAVRGLLQALGYAIEEMQFSRERTECCSYGGLMGFANPEIARKVIERRFRQSTQDFVTYCAMCRDLYASRGKPSAHVLDLIFAARPAEPFNRRSPGYSLRRENRSRLKRNMLEKIWGESMSEPQDYRNLHLVLSEEVQDLLEQRFILHEDIQYVIALAEQTGGKLLHKGSGHYLACARPANVTYWVEYSLADDAYVVHKAYSHRMEIIEETKS